MLHPEPALEASAPLAATQASVLVAHRKGSNQITAQPEHTKEVHELGPEPEGRVYFSTLVRGHSLEESLEPSFTPTRSV